MGLQRGQKKSTNLWHYGNNFTPSTLQMVMMRLSRSFLRMAATPPDLPTKFSLLGPFPDFEWTHIWYAKVENKCKVFSWLILQNRLWTADRILKCGGQPNPIYQLCRTHLESAAHMVMTCTYSQTIWTELVAWLGISLLTLPHNSYRCFKSWWRNMMDEGNPD
jgi:hypothetical protein